MCIGMLNNIMVGRYYPIYSKIHQMNSISKIICTILFIIMCFMSTTIKENVLLLILLVLLIFNTKIPFKVYLKALKSIRILLIFILIINLLFTRNIELSLIMFLRLIMIVLYTSILTLTTPPNEITYGLEIIFSPLKLFKIPVNKMAFSISLVLRFIPTIIDEANKILKSLASRGIDYYNSNLKGKLISLKALLIPMFVLTLRRADNLADALDVRLYDVNKKRINFRQNKWAIFDSFLIMLHLLILVVIVKGVI